MAPEMHVDSVPTFWSLGPRAHLLTGFLREWFIYHFSTEAGIENPDLRSYLWKATLGDSKILIESITRYRPQLTEQRPALVLRRDDWTVERLGIDDRLLGGVNLTGQEHYSTFIKGAHTLFCISSLPENAELLAAEVARDLVQFGPQIRSQLGLHKFGVAGVGRLGQLEEAHQNYAVPVTIGYAFEEKWVLIQQTPLLKRIVLSSFLP